MNNPDIASHEVWATKIFTMQWPEYEENAPALIRHLYDLQSAENQNIASGLALSAKPKSGLFESRFNLFATQNPELLALTNYIGDALRSVASYVNGGTRPPAMIDVVATESWFHITNNGGFHDAHYHGNCSWCGIFYAQAGDAETPQNQSAGNGTNRFYSPIGTGACYMDYGNAYLRKDYFDVQPVDGQLVLFPSFLLHSALPYTGDQDRIVISFNSQIFEAGPNASPSRS